MREAYRLHQDLWETGPTPVHVEAVLMYIGRVGDPPQFSAIENAIKKLMKNVAKQTP